MWCTDSKVGPIEIPLLGIHIWVLSSPWAWAGPVTCFYPIEYSIENNMQSRYTGYNVCLAKKFSIATFEEASCHAMSCTIERATWPGGQPARNQNPQSGSLQGTACHQLCYLEADLPQLSLRRVLIRPKPRGPTKWCPDSWPTVAVRE